MKASNHAVRRYLERELDVAPMCSTGRINASDRAVLRDLERERPFDVQLARREIEGVFERPRMENVAAWANGASFRVILGRRVYCCRGSRVTTFYRETPKGRVSVGRSQPRQRPGPAVLI